MERRVVTWKTPDISADGLKNFACAVMLLQTVGIAIVENGLIHLNQYTKEGLSEALAKDSHLMLLAGVGSVLQLLGGLAVPVFAFLLVEGFLHTGSFKKYVLRLFVFALISEIPYDLAVYGRAFDLAGQNALVSMSVCLLMLYFLRMMKGRKGIAGVVFRALIVLCAIAWVTVLRGAYGLCLVLLTAVFYLLYNRNGWKMLLGIAASLLYVTGPISFYGIWCYDGVRKDRIPRDVYYWFYPVHLLVLGVVAVML